MKRFYHPYSMHRETPTSVLSRSWFQMKEGKDGTGEIDIFDDIGLFGITHSDFTAQMRAFDGQDITVRINSPGGDVFEGLGIYNSLKNRRGNVHVVVGGIAASIASVVAMAGKTISMEKTSFMLIHNAWAFAAGDANDLRSIADDLEKISTHISQIYVDRSGQTPEDVKSMMDGNTLFSADEAVGFGLADQVLSNSNAQNKSIKFEWLERYGLNPSILIPEEKIITEESSDIKKGAKNDLNISPKPDIEKMKRRVELCLRGGLYHYVP